MKKIYLLSLCLLFSGCTSIQVNNSNGFNPNLVKQVCVVHNPKVIIKDFDNIVVRSFVRYNIQGEVVNQNSNLSLCQTVLHYTALRSWDFAPYMVSAQFNLLQNGRQVSESSFRLKGNGGMALNKWRSTETKVNELVDELMGKNDTSIEKPLQLSAPPSDLK